MMAECNNSVPQPDAATGAIAPRVKCGFQGEVPAIYGYPCPRCGMLTLSRLLKIPTEAK